MTAEKFVATHAHNATFERGLRSFFEYRDLGIAAATKGGVVAHVIRAAQGTEFSSQAHRHRTEFQLVYILKGWIEFEYEGQGVVRLEAGSCVYQPPRHSPPRNGPQRGRGDAGGGDAGQLCDRAGGHGVRMIRAIHLLLNS